MTILVCIPCLLVGGTEQQTLHLVEALVANGHRVITLCYYEYDRQVVARFTAADSEVVCLSAYGTRPTGLWQQYCFLRSGLRRAVRQYHPQIAHVQYMAPGALPLLLLRCMGIRLLIATVHTASDHYSSLRMIHFVQRHLTTVFTCVSQSAEQGFFGSSQCYTDALPLQRHNHFTLYNSIELPNNPVADTAPRSIGFTIGVVARLEPIKGVDLVMPAFAQVIQQHAQCRLLIVGDGSQREPMQQQQQELGISDTAIQWTGRIMPQQLATYYQQMDLVWCPSRSEGFGLTACEAMAYGCVVVAANVSGLAEIVGHDEYGVLFHAGSSADLADKTLTLLSDHRRLYQLRQQSLQRVHCFDFDTYQKAIGSLYNRLALRYNIQH